MFADLSRRELVLKTLFFVLLPAFVAYLLATRPDPTQPGLLCLESVASPAATSLTVFGPSDPADFDSPVVGCSVRDPHLLRRFVRLSLQARAYTPADGELRQQLRSYRLHVNKSLDTCQFELYQTKAGHELINGLDGHYYTCAGLVVLADSLFQHLAPRRP